MPAQSHISSITALLAQPAMRVLLTVATTALVAFGLFYLTPLRYVALIEPTINDIDPAEFYEMWQKNPDEYVFIDVRNQTMYDQLHAAGSALMPLHTLYDTRHSLPRRDKTIVLICSGGRASGVGYSYLEHYGFRNIRRIKGGIEAWQAAGLPVEGSAVQIVKSF